MSEPVEMVANEARRKADHALLLARVFATVVTLVVGLSSLLAGSMGQGFRVMFAEMGVELPTISRLVIGLPGVWIPGVLVLIGVTLFFIWAKGRSAAWMAALGLLLLAMILPIIVSAMFLPLVKIVSEMGNM